MLRSLMVPLDGSSLSEGSLPLAGEIARASGAAVHLAHVHVPYEPDHLLGNTQFQFEGVNVEEYDAQHRADEERYLSSLSQRFSAEGASADAQVLDGRGIAERLAAHAVDVEADLILMTTHGFTGLNRMWIGSVADEMIRQTPLPLFLLHPTQGAPREPPPIRHVLVPLDGSDLAEHVIGPASELARATGARMTLAHVVAVPQYGTPPVLPSLSDGRRLPLETALEYLEDLAESLREEGLAVDAHASHGSSPAEELARVAVELDADVIALATHGYGGVKRTLLGSVADKLLRSSPLPLLVIRSAQAA